MFGLLYRVLEGQLSRRIRRGSVLKHVGIVVDAASSEDRRQAPARAKPAQCARVLDEVLEWCAEFAIPAVTLWVLPGGRAGQAQARAAGVLGALEARLRALADDSQICQRRVRVVASGRLEGVAEPIATAARAARRATSGHGGMSLTIAAADDWSVETVSAVRTLLASAARKTSRIEEAAGWITPEAIGPRSLRAPAVTHPDLIICVRDARRPACVVLSQGPLGDYRLAEAHRLALSKVEFLRAMRSCQECRRQHLPL